MTDRHESGDVTFVEFATQSPLGLGSATIATFGPSAGCGRTRGPRLAPKGSAVAMLGESPEMKEVTEHLRKIAPSMAAVMLVGESGTGKEVAAEVLHAHSTRADKPFISVNCGAIPANLVEAELFGYERGAFTGAVRQHQGYFERAKGGTLFLDEITEMPIDLQAKLLRVLETGRMVRVGGSDEIPLDVRILTATNRPSEAIVRDHVLREDLYYRLAVFLVRLPPLRRRGGDIEVLANAFLDQLNRDNGTAKRFDRCALAVAATIQFARPRWMTGAEGERTNWGIVAAVAAWWLAVALGVYYLGFPPSIETLNEPFAAARSSKFRTGRGSIVPLRTSRSTMRLR